ncbi:hypothetical protein Q2K19_20510 [Micromonospora soli]|uniref:hypothetical protein n=1 Tax=Micromonospora sp. NBRC 110009 TaxID=3061627 RepID=UPI0026741D1D|nr:hypothetical protein [Micromonospora sp. NBRC 110009]WKT96585.1 hypothetical protein Q2K19_20510 [Micromonospora sp. NBRC 110009]
MSFEEYAALARELSARQRGGEQAVAAERERRRTLEAAVDQLGQRLAAQGQRLDQLGRAIGVPASPADTPVPVGSATSVGASGAPAPAGLPGTPPGAGAGATGGGAAAPGRPGVGAYPEGTVPAPRAGDPAAELAAARQLVDEADRYGQQAEAIAHRPVLLPTWSPLARAVGVYAACALAGSVVMLATLVGSPIPVTGLDLVAAGACAGVPLLSFVAGQLVLARWGRPVIGGGPPPSRYVPLGFVLCALLSSGLFCLYLVAFRLLR